MARPSRPRTPAAAGETAEDRSVTDRRGLLRGAAIGLGAAAAGAVLLPEPAGAAIGDPLVLGGPNNAVTRQTTLTVTGLVVGNDRTDTGLRVTCDSGYTAIAGANLSGVLGATGVVGASRSGPGLAGIGATGVIGSGSTGVEGRGLRGVYGYSADAGGVGVSGEATRSTDENYGVLGVGRSPQSRAVFGWNQVPGAVGGGTGVFGQANGSSGVGVRGLAWDGDPATGKFGTGVIGFAGYHDKASWPAARPSTGVLGASPAGTGVAAESTRGTALRVRGKAAFTRSGRAVVPAKRSYVDVVVPGGLTAASIVQATLQTLRPGVAVAAAVPNPATGKVRITLTKTPSRTRGTTVAWFVSELER